ncbi:hypothetical protein [Streptosporangium sp. NPDC000396]|uniref:hypothetical protein n=1 Tax=Streptosporangium sp. NPDC000396 TaxID=3366185 RepID=UPI00367FADBC
MNPRPEDLVPNPRRQMLEQTLAEVKARVAILEAALDPAHGQFTGQPVWVGPTARRFAEISAPVVYGYARRPGRSSTPSKKRSDPSQRRFRLPPHDIDAPGSSP